MAPTLRLRGEGTPPPHQVGVSSQGTFRSQLPTRKGGWLIPDSQEVRDGGAEFMEPLAPPTRHSTGAFTGLFPEPLLEGGGRGHGHYPGEETNAQRSNE